MFNFLIRLLKMAQKIWQKYAFAKLDENNDLVPFVPYQGMLRYQDAQGRWHYVPNPNESQMNRAGWYRIINVAEDGEDYIADKLLYHFTGAIPEDEGEV